MKNRKSVFLWRCYRFVFSIVYALVIESPLVHYSARFSETLIVLRCRRERFWSTFK